MQESVTKIVLSKCLAPVQPYFVTICLSPVSIFQFEVLYPRKSKSHCREPRSEALSLCEIVPVSHILINVGHHPFDGSVDDRAR